MYDIFIQQSIIRLSFYMTTYFINPLRLLEIVQMTSDLARASICETEKIK